MHCQGRGSDDESYLTLDNSKLANKLLLAVKSLDFLHIFSSYILQLKEVHLQREGPLLSEPGVRASVTVVHGTAESAIMDGPSNYFLSVHPHTSRQTFMQPQVHVCTLP